MKKIALTTVLLAVAAAAHAEMQQDSPLVQAARRSAARRKAPVAVITNATVAKSSRVLTTAKEAAPIPDYTAKATYAPAPSSPAPAPPPASPNPGRKVGDAYSVLAAGDPCLPQPSQNTSGGMKTVTAQNSPLTVQSTAYAPQRITAVSPTTAMNSSSGPAESQNAGANRQRRP